MRFLSAELYELRARMEDYRKPEVRLVFPRQYTIERKKILDNLEPRKFYFKAVGFLLKQLSEEFPERFGEWWFAFRQY